LVTPTLRILSLLVAARFRGFAALCRIEYIAAESFAAETAPVQLGVR
jgi:hypothetical protein